MYHDTPTPAQERALIAQVERAQSAAAAHAASRSTATPIRQVMTHQTIDRINMFRELLIRQVADKRTSDQLMTKVARAMAESRISEGAVYALLEGLHRASNRGAYFVAGAKKIFAASDLSWFEEDWQ